jgi:hypothetical protein
LKSKSFSNRHAFIQKHKDLFWFTPEDKKEEVSDELLITQVLNEADLETTFEMIEIVGEETVKNFLEGLHGRKAGNIYPEYLNFYLTYLHRHAQRNS